MRLDALLFRALGTFAILGLVMFARPRREPAPDRPVAPTAVTALPTATGELDEDDLIDRVARALGEPETRTVIPYEPPPQTTVVTRPRESEPRPAPLQPLPKELTAGRRAALSAILEGDAYLLFFGQPPGDIPDADDSMITRIEQSALLRQPSQQLRHVSIGDSIDPLLEEFVHDFNLQMLHAQARELVVRRQVDGIWAVAAQIDEDADEVLFQLLDDPTDAIATAYDPETGACELDLGKRDGVTRGMRFVLWTQARPLRRVLALAEVDRVDEAACRVRIVKSLAESWPAATGIRASNPFFHRGRTIAGYVLSPDADATRKRFEDWGHASLYATLQFPEFCIVGGIADPRASPRDPRERALIPDASAQRLDRARKAGAIFVPERLVPYLLPAR